MHLNVHATYIANHSKRNLMQSVKNWANPLSLSISKNKTLPTEEFELSRVIKIYMLLNI